MAGNTPLGNMVIKLNLDATNMHDSLTKTQNQLRNFEKQVKTQKGLADYYKTGTDAAKAYTAQKSALKGAIKEQETALKKLNASYAEEVEANGKFSKRAQRLAGQIEQGNAKLATLTNQLNSVDKQMITNEQSRINVSKAKIKSIDEQIKAQDGIITSYKNTEIAAQAYATKKKLVTQGYEEQSKLLKTLKSDYDNEIQANGQLTEKAQLLSHELALGEAKLLAYKNSLKQVAEESYLASSKLNAFGEKAIDFGGKAQKVGNALDTVSKSTRAMSLAILGGATVSAKAAIDFESAFTGVTKTVDEAKDANGRVTYSYKQLEEGIRDMAKRLPASAVEISKVAEAAGQLGIQTENVVDFSEVMINLGESTNMSAETAATALAKFKNITNMSEQDFDRLGSSLVDLGNNFATTEEDITNMALRLAGAGAQIGLSHADILGLSAALSSVGIEAEMGGSAFSKLMVKMQVASTTGIGQMEELSAKTGMSRRELELMSVNSTSDFKKLADSIGMTATEMSNIIKASKNLEDFANIAGMTAQDFKDAFERDAVGAIGAFVNGLGTAEEKGTTAIELLDEMGFREVRLRDTLLRSGNATKEFAKAVEMSNTAWNENSALTEEANKRYGTTESKLRVARNRLNDVAITLGGPLADALVGALDAAEPLIEGAADLATKFSNLDKKTQLSIIKMGMFLAAISPVSKVASTTANTIGGLSKNAGELAKWMANIGAEKAGRKSIEELGKVAENSATSTGGLVTGLSKLGSPVTWGILIGGAALAALSYVAIELDNAKKRTLEWGTEVDKVQAVELSRFKEKVDDTSKSMAAFGEDGAADVSKIKAAFKDLADEISTLADEKLAKDLDWAKAMGLSEEEIQRIRDRASDSKNAINGMADDVINIYKNAAENHRDLSEEERVIVKSAQTAMIEEKLALLGYEKNEVASIRKAMNGEAEELNREQANKALSVVRDWIEEENSLYKSQKSKLSEMLANKSITQETYNREMAELEANHLAVMEGYSEQYINLQKRVSEETMVVGENNQKALQNQIEKTMKELGVSFEEYQRLMEGTASKVSETSSLVGEYFQGMTDEARNAKNYWDSIVLDTKTGEVKTNALEAIKEALNAEGSWEAMKLSLKHGEMTTSAKIAVGEALIATEQWDSLNPKDKALVTDNRPAIEAILESETMLNQWNSLPESVKKILGENNSFLNSAEGAERALNKWNLMSPQEKDLVAKDLTGEDVNKAQQAINSLTGKTIIIDADNQTELPALEAGITVNGVKQEAPIGITATNETAPATAEAQATVNSPKQNAPIQMFGKDSTGPSVAQTNTSVNSPKQNTPIKMFGLNMTGPMVAQANAAVNSPKQKSPAKINAQDNASSVARQAKWSIDSIPGVKWVKIMAKKIGLEKGTNFHEGGLAMVNDQKGSLYKELVTLPTGESFIPQGRDVVLPLPRGSKVLTASKTKALMTKLSVPQYKTGVGIPEDAKILRDMERAEQRINIPNVSVNVDNAEMVSLLKEILNALSVEQKQTLDLTVKVGNRTFGELVEDITAQQSKNARRRRSSVII